MSNLLLTDRQQTAVKNQDILNRHYNNAIVEQLVRIGTILPNGDKVLTKYITSHRTKIMTDNRDRRHLFAQGKVVGNTYIYFFKYEL